VSVKFDSVVTVVLQDLVISEMDTFLTKRSAESESQESDEPVVKKLKTVYRLGDYLTP
jgi:hypothetical protein